jgi:hypothetical protein
MGLLSEYTELVFAKMADGTFKSLRSQFPSLDNEEEKLLFIDFLHYFGGTMCHDFFLINYEKTLHYTSLEWGEMIAEGSNEALAKDSLLTFFLFHTSVRDLLFFDKIGLDLELRKNYKKKLFVQTYQDYPDFYKKRNFRIYKKLGLTQEEALFINKFMSSS